MLPVRLLFSVALSNTPSEPAATHPTGDAVDLLRTAGAEEDAIERLQELIRKIGEPVATAPDVAAFEARLKEQLEHPDLAENLAQLAALSLEVNLTKVPSDLDPVVQQYADKFGAAQRWRIRQILDMLLELTREAWLLEPVSMSEDDDEVGQVLVDHRNEVAATRERDPELMRTLCESTVCNLVASAVLERAGDVHNDIGEALMARWYESTHAMLLRVDPTQASLDQELRRQQSRGRLSAVKRVTYQTFVIEGDLVAHVYLVVDDALDEENAVKTALDLKLARRMDEAYRTVDPEPNHVFLRVRYASEPGAVERMLGA